jgi:hypothetical protein
MKKNIEVEFASTTYRSVIITPEELEASGMSVEEIARERLEKDETVPEAWMENANVSGKGEID